MRRDKKAFSFKLNDIDRANRAKVSKKYLQSGCFAGVFVSCVGHVMLQKLVKIRIYLTPYVRMYCTKTTNI